MSVSTTTALQTLLPIAQSYGKKKEQKVEYAPIFFTNYDALIKPCQRWWWWLINSCAMNSVCEAWGRRLQYPATQFVKSK